MYRRRRLCHLGLCSIPTPIDSTSVRGWQPRTAGREEGLDGTDKVDIYACQAIECRHRMRWNDVWCGWETSRQHAARMGGNRVPTEAADFDGKQPLDLTAAPVVVERADFPHLLESLSSSGYHVIGPTVQDGAIVYDEISATTELPVGWTDEQAPGHYRLRRRADEALFGYNVGPHSWKRFLHPPLLRLRPGGGDADGVRPASEEAEAPRYAFIGVRACELRAIAIQDRVFLGGAFVEPRYLQRRKDVCLVAVNCGGAGETCFCASMNAGPRCVSDFDLCLTEVLDSDRHYFVVEVGSEVGVAIVAQTPHTQARQEDLAAVERIAAETAGHMGRSLDTNGIHDVLMNNLEHPRWNDVASRCLSCGNCTAVCPTCFCTTVEEVTDLTGERSERLRRWDSCFTADFTYIHGGSVRASGRSRYRQWLTHKLATWHDQFGSSGCVGCGRCVTWCPVGIDITQEVAAIRASGAPRKGA